MVSPNTLPAAGIPELRQAIADKHKRENGLTYKPSQIIVSCGGKHSCYNVILATCQEGDEVIIPAPYWLSYPEMVKLAGAKPVILETTDKTEFKVTPAQLRAAITPRTRLFVLNSPSNPTGSVYTPEETKALGDICVEKGVLIMSDEIYEHLLYDGATVKSVASFSQAHYDHTIIVHGFAKAWSMTGWRLGWCAAPEPIAKAIDAVQSHSTSNPTSFRAKGRGGRLDRAAGSFAQVARGICQAPHFRIQQAQFHPWHHLRECQGRVLSVPEHFRHGAQIRRLLREVAGAGKGRRRARHRLRRGRLHPPQLRHQHGEHREGLARIENFCKGLRK
jgi:alanine-alpha-ketoisovalerate/valine-pyruvate aminotransferase